MNKTSVPSPDSIDRQWFLVDAENQTLGRLATEVASVLRGKTKPNFTPHLDTGDFVIVVNAEKIKVTGSKFSDKKYFRHSLYPGGLKTSTFKELNKKNPEKIIEEAVKGMLPKNKLGKSMIKKLKVFKGPEHDHESQKPVEWNPSL